MTREKSVHFFKKTSEKIARFSRGEKLTADPDQQHWSTVILEEPTNCILLQQRGGRWWVHLNVPLPGMASFFPVCCHKYVEYKNGSVASL